jgi:hypothetical protein
MSTTNQVAAAPRIDRLCQLTSVSLTGFAGNGDTHLKEAVHEGYIKFPAVTPNYQHQ